MEALQNTNLIRKQIMLSDENIEKIEAIAKKQKLSVAKVVRTAIDSFNPNAEDSGDDSELMALVSLRLKEAIKDTAKTRKRLNKTLNKIESRGL
jgi:hypothetical protein